MSETPPVLPPTTPARRPRGGLLQRIGQALSLVPAFAYAFAFLALIPAYALLYYWLLPADFYHETVTHEQHYADQQQAIVAALRTTVRADLTDAYGGNVITAGDDRVCIDRIDLVNFAPTAGGEVGFSLVAPLYAPSSVTGEVCATRQATSVVMLNAVTDFGGTLEQEIGVADAAIEVATPWLTVRFADASSHVNAMQLFPAPTTPDTFRIGDDPVYHQFAIPPALGQEIIGLIRASQGFPRGIPGEFWRMVYLSAVTATTTGYGDIVPLTTRARLLTSSESILGVVMVGLFLNSLTQGGLLKLLPAGLRQVLPHAGRDRHRAESTPGGEPARRESHAEREGREEGKQHAEEADRVEQADRNDRRDRDREEGARHHDRTERAARDEHADRAN